MKHQLFTLTLGVCAFILLSQQIHAQPSQCGQRAAIVQGLAERYGETVRAMGLGGNNGVVEVFASEAGSWTITITLPNGMTCLIASGQSYEEMAGAVTLPKPGKDT